MPQYALRSVRFPVNNRFRFLGSSALSIARLAAAIAASLLSDVPEFFSVSVSTDISKSRV